MKYKVALQIVVMMIVVMCIQIFIPAFNFYHLIIVPDILIIFLTYIGFYYGRFYVIILGFLIGISQDFITQVELMGAMAFTKSAIGFGLGTLALYRNIWSGNIKMFFIFLLYNLHFLVFYFINFNGVPISSSIYIQVVLIHSLLSFAILFVIDKSFFNNIITLK
jgi:cell shape-determining protein MreD